MTTFAPEDFTKAKRSADTADVSNCVRIARRGDIVELRDDKVEFGSPADHRLHFTSAEFDAFQNALRAGETTDGCVVITQRADGLYEFRSAATGRSKVLVFDHGEVEAFYAGILEDDWPTPMAA